MTHADAGVPRLTVGILSHKRPHLLARVLLGLSQQDLPGFEVVVAGDLPSLDDYKLPAGLADGIRYLQVTEPNVCHARNQVIAAATGEIIAFCDDDAVPEPDWLRHIADPFTNSNIGAVGGLVRARDGLDVEWCGVTFDRSAREFPMDRPAGIHVMKSAAQLSDARFGGLMGANSAFRREAVLAVGGFDEAYRYFLDETDIALRLAEAGWDMALTDAAEVHHLREVNATRGHLKKPRNLHEVAASKAYFCVRHLGAGALAAEFARFRARRAADCDGFIRMGAMRGVERDRLLSQIDAGLAEGLGRGPRWFSGTWANGNGYVPWPAATQRPECRNIAIFCGWGYGRGRRLIGLGQRLVRAGHRVSVFRFQTGFSERSVTFQGGVWIHAGGTLRFDHWWDGRLLIHRRSRCEAELRRIEARRSFDLVLSPASSGNADLSVPGVPPLAARAMMEGVDVRNVLAELTSDLGCNSATVVQNNLANSVQCDRRHAANSAMSET